MSTTQKLPSRTGILVRALIILFVGGMVNSAAVFVNPLAEQFSWSTESVAGVITFMATMQTPGHILSGWMLGRVGAKKTLIIGCVLLGLAFVLSGLVPAGAPWLLYVTFSVFQGLGVGFTYTGATYCATGWYPDKRGLASGLCMALNGGSATFLAPLVVKLIDVAGYSVAAATLGVSLYSISNVLSRFLFGALIDKTGYRKVYTLCGVLCVAAAVCLMFANSLFMFYAAYVLLAFGFGPTNSCRPVAVQETFGSKYAGGIFGVCMLGYMLICTIISPRISSALVASTGDYTASMIYAIIACVAAVAVYTTIPMPKRRTLAEVGAEEASKA